MKDESRLLESIDRFQRGLWNREAVDRPPVGVTPERSWLPINYLKVPLESEEVHPEDVSPSLVRTDYEDASFARRVFADDWLPYAAAWRAIPWLEAICGCGVRAAEGSMSARRRVESPEGLAELPLPASDAWLAALRAQTAWLVSTCPADCFVSPTILRGLTDVLAGLRGLDGFFLDLYDAPELVSAAAARVGKTMADVVAMHFELVPPKLGGFGNIYGYWAPGPTVVIQEDMMGLCSPDMFRDLFLEHENHLVEQLGPNTFFHVHSTGYDHYRHVLAIPGLAGMQIWVEANGPSLPELLPAMREILGETRLILSIDAHFDQLPGVLRQLPRDGLYVTISDKFLPTDEAFRTFVEETW